MSIFIYQSGYSEITIRWLHKWSNEYVKAGATARNGYWPGLISNVDEQRAAWAKQFIDRAASHFDAFSLPCGRIEFADIADAENFLAGLLGEETRQETIKQNGTHHYVRFGALPTNGRSRNHRDNMLEAGVSVYDAYQLDGTIYVDLSGADAISAAFIMQRADHYIVTGTLVGQGSDGEPVLTNATAVRTDTPVAIL
jgi:hypothetical protein